MSEVNEGEFKVRGLRLYVGDKLVAYFGNGERANLFKETLGRHETRSFTIGYLKGALEGDTQ